MKEYERLSQQSYVHERLDDLVGQVDGSMRGVFFQTVLQSVVDGFMHCLEGVPKGKVSVISANVNATHRVQEVAQNAYDLGYDVAHSFAAEHADHSSFAYVSDCVTLGETLSVAVVAYFVGEEAAARVRRDNRSGTVSKMFLPLEGPDLC